MSTRIKHSGSLTLQIASPTPPLRPSSVAILRRRHTAVNSRFGLSPPPARSSCNALPEYVLQVEVPPVDVYLAHASVHTDIVVRLDKSVSVKVNEIENEDKH